MRFGAHFRTHSIESEDDDGEFLDDLPFDQELSFGDARRIRIIDDLERHETEEDDYGL